MKRSIPLILICFIFLLGCGDSENKPSTKDYEKQFSVEIPAYLELSSFDVEASENVGSKVEPYYKARFKATVKLKTKTFELSNQENEATFIRPVADEGEKKEIYGMAGARLSAGNWKIDFNLENNPIPALGHPKDFFTGGRVIIVGTAEESEFKAQMEQKQLVAQQDAERALKAQQIEQEKQNAERERKANELIAERERKGKALAAELEIKRKATELEQAKKDEELRIFRETSPVYLVGQWSWTCCRGKYQYVMSITSHTPDGYFTGYFSDGNGKISGRLAGNNVEFTRVLGGWGSKEQKYIGKLAGSKPNLKIVQGTWSGAYEENGDGNDWHAEMTSQ